MNHYLWIILHLTFLINLTGQSTPNVDQSLTPDPFFSSQTIDLIFEKAAQLPEDTQVSIGLVKNDSVHYLGIRRIKDTLLMCDLSKAIFEIGSITKVFTSTLLAEFVLNSGLHLNDNINDYLPFELNKDQSIAFIQLANHTSGLPRMPTNLDLSKVNPNNPYESYGEEELTLYLSGQMELSTPPGKKYVYSNLGVGLLGYLLSSVAHTSYENLLQTKIFNKYGMVHSTTIQGKVQDQLIKGINDQSEIVSNWDMNVLQGAGGILSSVEDLTKFARAQFDTENKALALTRTSTHQVSDQMRQGLGWGILIRKEDSAWYWHNGGTGGYTSSMIVDVKNRNSVVVLSNLSAFSKRTDAIGELSHELMVLLSK